MKFSPTSLISRPITPMMNHPFPLLFFSLISIISIGLINARLYKLQGNQQLMSDLMIQKSEIEGEFLYVFMEPPSMGFLFQSVEAAMLVAWLEMAHIPHYIFSNQFLLASPKGKPIFAQFNGEYLEGVDEIINKMGKWQLEKLKTWKAENKKNGKKDKKDKDEQQKKKEEEKEKKEEEKRKNEVEKEWKKMEKQDRPFIEAIKDIHKILLKLWLDHKKPAPDGTLKNRFERMIGDESIQERIWFTLLLPIVTKQPIWIEFNGGIIGENSEHGMKLKIDEKILIEYYNIILNETGEKKLNFMKNYKILIEQDINDDDEIVQVNDASMGNLGEFEQSVWKNFTKQMKSLNKEMVDKELRTIAQEELKLRENMSNLPIKIKVIEKMDLRIVKNVKIPLKRKKITKNLVECTNEELVTNLKILFETIMEECELHTYNYSHLFDNEIPGKAEAYLLGLLFFIFKNPSIMETIPNFSKYFEKDHFTENFTDKNMRVIYNYYKSKSGTFYREKSKMIAWPWPMKGAHTEGYLKDVESDMAENIRQAINVAQQIEGAQVDYPWLEGLVDSPSK